jgi:NAD(P)-dependent dehydrogenase (short-subunit alcohol dehydrogenase family)
MPRRRKPRVVVVTGASAGVGRATVREYARRGCRIGLLARGLEGLEATRREVEELGGEALVLPTDVADPDQVEAAAEAVEARFGPIDVWVNNAMVTVFGPVKTLRADEIRRVTEVTYLGQVHGTLSALRRMLPRDRGVIVQVGSALCYRGIPLQAAYCGAKHAIEGFTESLRTELMHDGSKVRVTMVHLPAVNTPQFDWSRSRMPRKAQPVPPIFAPEVAARAVLWASENPRRQVVVGAPSVKAIWGNRLAPWAADRYLARNGYDAQMTPAPEDPARPDNLWAPVEGDFGAHGRFDREQKTNSLQLWVTTHRHSLLTAAVGLIAGSAMLWRAGRGNALAHDAFGAIKESAGSQPRRMARLVRRLAKGG